MTLTSTILEATYAPFAIEGKRKNQSAYIADHLCYDYYHRDTAEIYPTAANINGMFRGRRLCPAPIRQHYLDKFKNLLSNIRHRIIPFYPNAQCVVDHLHTIIQTSGIFPEDIAYINSYYRSSCTQTEAAEHMAQVIWYVMQTDRLTTPKRTS